MIGRGLEGSRSGNRGASPCSLTSVSSPYVTRLVRYSCKRDERVFLTPLLSQEDAAMVLSPSLVEEFGEAQEELLAVSECKR